MKPKATVDIVEVNDPVEALALRSALEWWGIQVTLHVVGQAQDLVDILGGQATLSSNVILMCHGDEQGLTLPQLGEEIEAKQPYHGILTPDNFKEFLVLPDCVAVNTGCAQGRPEVAVAFLGAGCRAYLAPDGYPSGDASLFFTLHFYYEWLCKGTAIPKAHEKASSHGDDTGLFKLYENPRMEQT